MVDAKIAEKMDRSVVINQKGEVVEELNQFGMKVDTKLTHPEYCHFADKTRCNTSMKKDDHIAGTRYIIEHRTQAQQVASTSEGQITVLCFIPVNDQQVCCVVIFQSNFLEPKLECRKGINLKVNPVRLSDGEIDFIASSGPGIYYPGSPQCVFNHKTIDCLVFCSKSGGITTEILMRVLKYFDEKMFSLASLVVPYYFSLLIATILAWIPASSNTSTMISINGKYACGSPMQLHCGRLVIQLRAMGHSRQSCTVRRTNCCSGNMTQGLSM